MIRETRPITETAVGNEQAEPVVQRCRTSNSLRCRLTGPGTGRLQLTGEGGLLQQLTKRVLESALEGEITDHVGYEKHDAAGKNNGNSRNGTWVRTVLTDVGPAEVKVPRATAGTLEPQIVKKRQRRPTGVDEMVCHCPRRG
jgi:transposase-like protein